MPEPTTPDQVAAYLAEVRERHSLVSGPESGNWGRLDDLHAASYQLSHQDAGCLLAAVEAVLGPHQPGPVVILGALCPKHENHRYFSITAVEAADVTACPDCTATARNSCAYCGPHVPWDACPVRSAISRALLGEGNGG